MQPVGLASTRISADYAPKSPRSLVLRKSGHDPGKEMHSAPSYFPPYLPSSLRCGLSFYYCLSSLSLCFPAQQVRGIGVLFCAIGDQKVVKHLLLFLNSLSQLIWLRSARVCTSR